MKQCRPQGCRHGKGYEYYVRSADFENNEGVELIPKRGKIKIQSEAAEACYKNNKIESLHGILNGYKKYYETDI
jgi:hypothetical protein